jgi:hypothetical protein
MVREQKRDVIERWWNGQYGRLVRQDVRLYREERWTVELSEGGADSERLKPFHFTSEEEARAYLAHCLATGHGDWRKLAG